MDVFDFFKKKRINQYLRSANNYIAETFKPEPPLKKPDVRYSLPKVKPEEKHAQAEQPQIKYSLSPAKKEQYSSQETDLDQGVRYSESNSGNAYGIPNLGDSFTAASVKLFLSQNANNPKLNQLARKLDECLNLTFVDMLTRYINEKGWRDSRVYKAAQIDRRLFSKIMSDREYKPAKDTALALAIALELTLQQTNDLLDRAGYTLSHSNKRDVIIEYFIREGVHNLADINEVLYKLDQKIIGR